MWIKDLTILSFIKKHFIKESLACLKNVNFKNVFRKLKEVQSNQTKPNSISTCISKHVSSFNLKQLKGVTGRENR